MSAYEKLRLDTAELRAKRKAAFRAAQESVARGMAAAFDIESTTPLDFYEAIREPGESRAEAKLRHFSSMYGGQSLLTRGNGLKLRFQLACGCTLLQTFDFYKSRTPRVKKTIVSRLYPRQPGQSESVVSAGFFELVANEGCKEHYPQPDLFGIHSFYGDLAGGGKSGPTQAVDPQLKERPISNYEVVRRDLISKTFSHDEALRLVRDIAQRVR